MNIVLNNLETRRSCKNFLPDMITDEELEKVLKAGTFAPTGMNKQSPIIIAVTNKDLRDELAKRNAAIMGRTEDPFYNAPVVLIVLANKDIGTYLYDGSLVMGNLLNAAHAINLGSCWIHRAKEEFESDWGKEFLRKLGIEGNYEGIGHCVLGYPVEEHPEAKPRKDNYIYYCK